VLAPVQGIACGGGTLFCTDNDRIEVSNLNRQFLFRKDNVGKPKSATAAAAAQAMNPALNVRAMEEVGRPCPRPMCTPLVTRCGSLFTLVFFLGTAPPAWLLLGRWLLGWPRQLVYEGTESIFNEEFMLKLDFVTNALDNVKARNYVDGRCVFFERPLFESGTLGTKGNVQVESLVWHPSCTLPVPALDHQRPRHATAGWGGGDDCLLPSPSARPVPVLLAGDSTPPHSVLRGWCEGPRENSAHVHLAKLPVPNRALHRVGPSQVLRGLFAALRAGLEGDCKPRVVRRWRPVRSRQAHQARREGAVGLRSFQRPFPLPHAPTVLPVSPLPMLSLPLRRWMMVVWSQPG
jgi:hypothetical protein